MTFSLPVTISAKKSMDKTIQITIPAFHEKLITNKLVQAFLTVLRAPIK